MTFDGRTAESAMKAAAEQREASWLLMSSKKTLGRMSPQERDRSDNASSAYRDARATLIAGLWERRGRWEHGGKVYRLAEDGDGLVVRDLSSKESRYNRAMDQEFRRLDRADIRRFGAAEDTRAALVAATATSRFTEAS